MDPNMGGNMNPNGKFSPNYQYMQGGNPGPMAPMNQMYMNPNPYMGNFYPMGMPQPNSYPNNYPQQNNNFQNNNNNFGNKGRKQSDKQNYQKLDIKRI